MEMSHNARVKFKKDLAKRVTEFYNDCHQAEDGRFCEAHGVYHSDEKTPTGHELWMIGRKNKASKVIKTREDPFVDKYDEKEDPWGPYVSKEELEKHEGMSAKTYAEALGRGIGKRAPFSHGMTQKEFIEVTGRRLKTAADNHPITQREFIEATGRGNAKKAANDHPMTIKEFVEATGRRYKDAPNDHPMTEDEYRRAMGLRGRK